jgi:hypothetical protein
LPPLSNYVIGADEVAAAAPASGTDLSGAGIGKTNETGKINETGRSDETGEGDEAGVTDANWPAHWEIDSDAEANTTRPDPDSELELLPEIARWPVETWSPTAPAEISAMGGSDAELEDCEEGSELLEDVDQPSALLPDRGAAWPRDFELTAVHDDPEEEPAPLARETRLEREDRNRASLDERSLESEAAQTPEVAASQDDGGAITALFPSRLSTGGDRDLLVIEEGPRDDRQAEPPPRQTYRRLFASLRAKQA